MKKPAEVKVRGESIIFSGSINESSNAKLFEAFDKAEKPPTSLTITSGGGFVGAGLEMGEWIVENNLDVYIPSYCSSSCANYVFTAGRRVTLGSMAVVSWHGSPVADDLVEGTAQEQTRRKGVLKSLKKLNPELENPEAYWDRIRAQNRRFFRAVGVHPVITMLSSVADKSSLEQFTKAGTWKNYGAYISIEDMRYFGVDNVSVVKDKTWKPRSNIPGTALIKVELVDDIESRLAELNRRLEQFD